LQSPFFFPTIKLVANKIYAVTQRQRESDFLMTNLKLNNGAEVKRAGWVKRVLATKRGKVTALALAGSLVFGGGMASASGLILAFDQTKADAIMGKVAEIRAIIVREQANTSYWIKEADTFKTRAVTAEGQVAGLTNERDSLKTERDSLKTQLTEKQAQVTALTTERDNLQAQLTALQGSSGATETEKARLEVEVNKANAHLDKATTELDAIIKGANDRTLTNK
jgi:predicted  nucleic acid-binding Zn-ribbon protein